MERLNLFYNLIIRNRYVMTLIYKFKIIWVSILLIFAISSNALPASFYVDNVAYGLNNGTSWADAWQSFSAIKWGLINPGDILYISGGTTSKTYTEMLSISKVATQANPITVKVGQDYGHTGTVILEGTDVYALNLYGANWITISGQLGSGTTPNMILRNHSKDEVRVNGAKGIVLEYIEIGPNIHVSSPDGGNCVNMEGGFFGGSNRIHHNKIHNCYGNAMTIQALGGTPVNANYLRIDNNEIYLFGVDGIHSAVANGITIDHNDIHNSGSGANFDTTYSDGMQLRGFEYLTVAYNKIHDIEGADSMFGYMYLECDLGQSNVAAHDMYIYNNVIWETDHSYNHFTGGIIFACKACASITNVSILNNTIIDMEGNPLGFNPYNASSVSNVVVANNILYNGNMNNIGGNRNVVAISFMDSTPRPTTGSFGAVPTPNIIWDYNLVAVANSDVIGGTYGSGGGSFINYATWKTNSGGDVHGVAAEPLFVNWKPGKAGDLHLSSKDSSAKDKGINRNEFSDDYDGNIRSKGPAWDIGAFEFMGDTIAPKPPKLNP